VICAFVLASIRPHEVEAFLDMHCTGVPESRQKEIDRSLDVLAVSDYANDAALAIEGPAEEFPRALLIERHHAVLEMHNMQQIDNLRLVVSGRNAYYIVRHF
jgi:hypothetical protein